MYTGAVTVPYFTPSSIPPPQGVELPPMPVTDVSQEGMEYAIESTIDTQVYFDAHPEEIDQYAHIDPVVGDTLRLEDSYQAKPDPVPVAVKTPEEIVVRAEKTSQGHLEFHLDFANIQPQIYGNAGLFESERAVALRLPNISNSTRINEWLKQFPNTEYKVSIQVSPQTRTGLQVKLNQIQRLKTAVREENRMRKDRKHKGMFIYIAFLNLVTKTWGRVSELVDFVNVLQDNLLTDRSVGVYDSKYDRDYFVEKGTRLSDLPVEVRKGLIEAAYEGRVELTLDQEGFITGLIQEQLMDAAVGFSKQYERKALNNLGSWKNTQNASTMINNGLKNLNAYLGG